MKISESNCLIKFHIKISERNCLIKFHIKISERNCLIKFHIKISERDPNSKSGNVLKSDQNPVNIFKILDVRDQIFIGIRRSTSFFRGHYRLTMSSL